MRNSWRFSTLTVSKYDHTLVLVEAPLPRPKVFTWETHEYLQLSGTDKFIKLLNETNWSELRQAWPDQDKMKDIFPLTLERHLKSCFSWKRVRRKWFDKPWKSDTLRDRIKTRLAIFRNEGRIDLWKKKLIKEWNKGLNSIKKMYEESIMKGMAEMGHSNQWYSIFNIRRHAKMQAFSQNES